MRTVSQSACRLKCSAPSTPSARSVVPLLPCRAGMVVWGPPGRNGGPSWPKSFGVRSAELMPPVMPLGLLLVVVVALVRAQSILVDMPCQQYRSGPQVGWLVAVVGVWLGQPDARFLASPLGDDNSLPQGQLLPHWNCWRACPGWRSWQGKLWGSAAPPERPANVAQTPHTIPGGGVAEAVQHALTIGRDD